MNGDVNVQGSEFHVHGSALKVQHSTWTILVIALAVAIVAVWVYWPCLQGGFLTNMDDDVYMAAAEKYRGLTAAGIRWAFTETRPYYQPLPRLTHLLSYSIWGVRPAEHHAVNLALHASNAALVTFLAWVLLNLGAPPGRESASRSDDDHEKVPWIRAGAAGFVGLIFAVHPLQAESVAWIAGRTQLLCATLMLGCVLAYVRAARSDRRGRWLVSGAFLIAAWLSKPIVVTLPFVLLVLDWFPLRRHLTGGWGPLVREKLWMFAASIGLTVLTLYCASRDTLMVPDTRSLGFWQRTLVAERAVVFYFWKLIWPAWLSPFYPLSGAIRLASAEFYVPALVLAIACLGVWLAHRRAPALAAAGTAYLALLLPVSGLAQFGGESVANRHMYLAMLPLVLVAAGAGARLAGRVTAAGRAVLITVAVAAVVGLAGRAHVYVRMWHDDETLWRNVLQWYPDFAFGNWKVAEAAIARRDFAVGLPCAIRALEGYPEDKEVRGMLGLAYLKTRSYEAAARTLEPLARTEEWMPAARYNLACAYARLGSNDAAIVVLRELLPREPRFVELARRDRELAGLRSDPRFAEAILGAAR